MSKPRCVFCDSENFTDGSFGLKECRDCQATFINHKFMKEYSPIDRLIHMEIVIRSKLDIYVRMAANYIDLESKKEDANWAAIDAVKVFLLNMQDFSEENDWIEIVKAIKAIRGLRE